MLQNQALKALPPNCGIIQTIEGLPVLVDEADYEKVSKYEWHAELFKCSFYANARITVRGRKRTLRMHRLIANTPPRKVTHHLNHNTLDNRRCNLVNLTPTEHMIFHSNNKIRVKFARQEAL